MQVVQMRHFGCFSNIVKILQKSWYWWSSTFATVKTSFFSSLQFLFLWSQKLRIFLNAIGEASRSYKWLFWGRTNLAKSDKSRKVGQIARATHSTAQYWEHCWVLWALQSLASIAEFCNHCWDLWALLSHVSIAESCKHCWADNLEVK